MSELNDRRWNDVEDVVRDLLAGPGPTSDMIANGRARLLAELHAATPHPPRPAQPPAPPRTARPTGLPQTTRPSGFPQPAQHAAPSQAALRRNGARPVRLVEAAARHDGAPPEPGPARRRRGRGRLAVALAGGALAAGAVLVVTTTVVLPNAQRPEISQTAIARPAARPILLAAADAIATAPTEGDYWRVRKVIRSTMVEPGRAYVLERGLSEEQWLARRPGGQGWRISRELGTTPATPQDETAWRAAGSPSSWRYPTDVSGLNATSDEKVKTAPDAPEATKLTGGWRGSGGTLLKQAMPWAELAHIPSGPDELRAYLEGRITAESVSGDLEPRLREACMQILRGLAVAPDVRAGAYRLLATLPGMRADGEVTDPLGRRGQALSYEVEASPGQMTEVRFVVDPRTGLPLAEETTAPAALADGRAVELRHSTSYEAIGWTDDRPATRG